MAGIDSTAAYRHPFGFQNHPGSGVGLLGHDIYVRETFGYEALRLLDTAVLFRATSISTSKVQRSYRQRLEASRRQLKV